MQHTSSLFFHYLLEYNAIFKENDVIYRRSKFLVLTEDGQELAARTVDLVIEQEQLAIASMGQESMKQFLSLFRIYTDALKQHFQTIAPESSAGDQPKENFYENPVI